MKKLTTLFVVLGVVLALAPAAQAELIAHTGFEDPASGVSDFTPSGTDTEIGFSVPSGGNFVVTSTGGEVITGSQSFRMKTSVGDQQNDGYPDPLTDLGTPVTFDTVDLSGFSGVEFSVDIDVINPSGANYEYQGSNGGEAYRVFLDLFNGTSTNTVTVFDSWVDIGDLDNVFTLGTTNVTYDIPDNTVSATAGVFWNSTSVGEGIVIDNLTFNGAARAPGTMISAQ